jgi:DNA repair exonuclease SbcCD ATPase subunit
VIALDAARWLVKAIPAEVWAGLLLLGALGVGAWWAYDTGRDSARAEAAQEIAELKAQVAKLEEANTAAVDVIARLQEVNRELAEGRAADQEAAAEAVADLRSERDALQRELDRRRTDRGVIYERDPSAAAWAATRVPDAVARSLRE